MRLAQISQDFEEFARAAVRVLRRAVPFDRVAVVAFDPASALPVEKWIENFLTGSAHLVEMELHEADVDEFRRLAASGRRAARMSRATGDELRAVCFGDSGMWGAIVMHRDRGAPAFTARDVALLASLTGGVAEVQRMRLKRDLSANAGDRDPGLLLVDEKDGIEMANAAATVWLDEMRDHGQRLPLVVTAAAQRARAIASGRSDVAATARVRAASGRWVLVRASVLGNGTDARTAVTLASARAPELAELVADAHGLTMRERRVTELVARGLPTAAIAARLHLSTYTVQDHLKATFEKLEVSSRGELVAKLFLGHDQVGGGLSDPASMPAA